MSGREKVRCADILHRQAVRRAYA